MGKAAKFKKLRRLASQLPPLTTHAVIGQMVSGKDLSGVVEKDGKGNKINPLLNYTRKTVVNVPLNHNRKMKQFYNKFGMDGVKGYGAAVVDIYESKKPKS